MLGQWKNFDELEEYLTLDELIEAFNALTERENREMEFHARMAGMDVKGSSSESQSNEQANDNDEETLADRLRRRKQEKLESGAKGEQKSEFSHGVGYHVVGG